MVDDSNNLCGKRESIAMDVEETEKYISYIVDSSLVFIMLWL